MLKVKKSGILLAFLALALMCLAVAAPPAKANTKIGVVDMEKAVNECKEGKRAQAELRRRASKLENELKALSDDVQKLRQELQNTSMLLKQEAKLSKERELERKARQLDTSKRDANLEMREAQRDSFAPILRKMAEIIEGLGKSQGYTLILETRAAIYFPGSVDITKEVIKAYDSKNP